MLFGMIGIASSQDFSWGLNSSLGVTSKFGWINNVIIVDATGYTAQGQSVSNSSNADLNNMRVSNYSVGLNVLYRLRKRISIGLELNYISNTFSDSLENIVFISPYMNSQQVANAYFESKIRQNVIKPILIMDVNLTNNLHLFGGLGMNIWSNEKTNFNLKSMVRYDSGVQDSPLYSDQQEISILERNVINNSVLNMYSNISSVFGVYYQMNNIKVGYRHYGTGLTKGLHQLTLGYDIGRYKYQ
jgi:hypothetical protein